MLRVTIWYPAPDTAPTQSIDIGPSDNILFELGTIAPDAPFAATGRRPVILLSHGFGGAARVMIWFARAMVDRGYIVVGVDHPGNNGIDQMTENGAALWWERAADLKTALDTALTDPVIGPHIDAGRVGVAGFSIGGFTALLAGGARPSIKNVANFCRTHPSDGMCLPQIEFPINIADLLDLLNRAEVAPSVARMTNDHRLQHIRAVFAMAPVVQTADPESLAAIAVPTAIVTGDADKVVPMASHAAAAAARIPDVSLTVVKNATHYSFLGLCTDAARASVPVCRDATVQTEAHGVAIDRAAALFAEAFGENGDREPRP